MASGVGGGVHGTVGKIACPLCGVLILPNATNLCYDCLKGRVDVTEGIARQGVVTTCVDCGRFTGGAEQNGRERWVRCEPESPDLLALCLRSLAGLGRGKAKGGKANKGGAEFVDASFIWTEPHSRRIKLSVTVERTMHEYNSAVLRQKLAVELTIKTRLCPDCTKEGTGADHTSIVQVRQQVRYKRTLLQLENRLMSNGTASKAVRIESQRTGIDFYFGKLNEAKRFADHVASCVPARRRDSKQLQSQDDKNNITNYVYTMLVEVVPLCKNDLVVLPARLRASLFGGRCAWALVESVSSTVNLVHPPLLERARLSEQKYFSAPCTALLSGREATEFVVLDVQPPRGAASNKRGAAPGAAVAGVAAGAATAPAAPEPWEVEVARASDLGENDVRFTVLSHIGHLLQPGDSCLGFDISAREGDSEFDGLPPVILVQKKQDEEARRAHKRRGKRAGEQASRGDASAADDDQQDQDDQQDGDGDDDAFGVDEFADSAQAAEPRAADDRTDERPKDGAADADNLDDGDTDDITPPLVPSAGLAAIDLGDADAPTH
jgi:nonsense-mediated mRNA decay protein 3